MFTNVLIGVDGRPTGRDAVALARRLAGPEARLTIVHVHAEDSAEDSLALLEREAREIDVDVEAVSVEDYNPGRGLHREAERVDADLLVVGSCARGLLGRAMLGDDTRAALNGAPCAIAIAAKGVAARDRPFARIGVGYNETPESEAALQAARELASAYPGATIHVLEVVSLHAYAYAGYYGPGVAEAIEDMVTEARARLAELPGVQGQVVNGLAGEELARFGDDVEILVAGSRGYGPIRRLIVGSTCEYLERHARCSLLVLPRKTTP